MEIKKDILIRTYIVYLLIVGMGVVIIASAIYTQQIKGGYWKKMADEDQHRTEKIMAERGSIYAEDGSVLSTSIPEFDIYIDFGADALREKKGELFRKNIDSLSWYMADLFKDEDPATYRKIFQTAYDSADRYFLFKRKISFQQWEVMKQFPLVRLGKNKSGFIAEVRMKRLNPFKLFANRTIGIARDSNKVGLEKAYDTVLAGVNGERLVRYIAGGAGIPIDGSDVEAVDGHDIVTTLDIAIQDIAEQALSKMMYDNQCEHGTCIVMEVKTGKIRAIANLGRIRDNAGRLRDSAYKEVYNYAISTSEPGSTFKLATLISVMEDGLADINSPVDLEGGKWKVAGETVYDAEYHGLHQTTVQHAFEHSSNVGMAKLAYNNYYNRPMRFIDHLHRLRFDTLTGIDLPGEVTPTVYKPGNKHWSNTTLPWMGFGYALAVSPLQTLTLYNAVANGGKMMRPYLVTAIKKDGVTIKENQPVVVDQRICSPKTIQQLFTCLEGVVLNGTAKKLKTDAYRFGGKTGTALVADKGITYADRVYQSSFAGFFPMEDPQYSCIVVIRNRPHAARFFGADVAGPVFREVADKLYGMKVRPSMQLAASMRRDSSGYQFIAATNTARRLMKAMAMDRLDSSSDANVISMVTTGKDLRPVLKAVPLPGKTMPLIKGLTLKDALALCEHLGLRPTVSGSGKVLTQSIEPGRKVVKGQTVHIILGTNAIPKNEAPTTTVNTAVK